MINNWLGVYAYQPMDYEYCKTPYLLGLNFLHKFAKSFKYKYKTFANNISCKYCVTKNA